MCAIYTLICNFISTCLQESQFDKVCVRLDRIENQLNLFFSSGVASALLSPTVQHFSNLAQQYQFPVQAPQNQPVMNRPGVNQSVVNQPAVNQPVMNRPGVNQPVVNQPAVNQPAVNQPVVNQPAVNQPVMNRPGVNQPVVNQPAVNQPVVNQPVVNQPVMNWSGFNQPVESEVNQSFNLLVSSNHTLGDASRLDTSATFDELDTSAGTYLYLWPYILALFVTLLSAYLHTIISYLSKS